MRNTLIITLNELRLLLQSSSTYIATALFLALMAIFYLVAIDSATREISVLPVSLFYQGFFIPVWFMVPFLTMRSLSEERRHGTLETLMTTPVSALEIVLSKFIACYLFYLFIWGLTLLFPVIIGFHSPEVVQNAHLMSPAPLAGGLLFVMVSGSLYLSIGLLCSSLTRSSLIAGMLTFTLLFILIAGSLLATRFPIAEFKGLEWLKHVIAYLMTFQHLDDFCKGIIDTRPLVLYVSTALLTLGLTSLSIETRA